MRRLLLAAAAAALVALGGPVHAHSGSYDMKYVDGANLVLLTFNTHEPVSGLDIVHNLRLYDMVGAPIPYDEVRITVRRVGEGGGPLESTRPVLEVTEPMQVTNESEHRFSYPVSGAYAIAAEFTADGRRISAGEFAVAVGRGTEEEGAGLASLHVLGAFLLGLLVASATRILGGRLRRGAVAPPDVPARDTVPVTLLGAEPADGTVARRPG